MNHIVINPISTPNLDGLLDAYPDKNTFYFKNGDYHLTEPIVVNRTGVRFISLSYESSSVNIYQDSENKNAFDVHADNVTFAHLSVHVTGTCACISFYNCNWTNTENCRFYGDQDYAISYVGPTNGDPEIDNYNNNVFNINNTFDNNIVYIPNVGNALLFSLQKYGAIRNNIIRGGMVLLNLLSDVIINNNYVFESLLQGIRCSLPCNNIQINGNNITKATNAAVNLILSDAYLVHKDIINNVDISHNSINNSKFIGIEINNGKNINISNNKIKWTQEHGVYVVRSDNITVENNNIVKMTRGVTLDVDTTNCNVNNNTTYSVIPFTSINGVFCETMTDNNNVNNNTLKGKYQGDAVNDLSETNSVNGNNHIENISFNEEVLNLID